MTTFADSVEAIKAKSGFLHEVALDTITFACARCKRRGRYSIKTLKAKHGNPPLADLPKLVAIAGGCEFAKKYPGVVCGVGYEI